MLEEQLSKKVTLEQETKPGMNLWEDFQTAAKAQGIKELLGLGEVVGKKGQGINPPSWNLYFKNYTIIMALYEVQSNMKIST